MKKIMEYLDKVLPTVWGTALATFVTLLAITGVIWAFKLLLSVLGVM